MPIVAGLLRWITKATGREHGAAKRRQLVEGWPDNGPLENIGQELSKIVAARHTAIDRNRAERKWARGHCLHDLSRSKSDPFQHGLNQIQ